MTRDEFYVQLPNATQAQKDQALFMMVENLQYAEVAALAKAGAKLNGGNNMLGYALSRTNDMELVNVLLDAGWSAKGLLTKDLWYSFGEDKDEAYRTLGRLINAGLDDEERIKAAASALKKGDFVYINAYILKPNENVVRLINFPDWGKQTVAWDREDTRDITQDDIDKYIAWNHSLDELYKTHFANGIDEARLKETVTAEGTTGLMLAVRAGKFAEVLDYYRAHPELSPSPAEYVREDRYGQNVMKLLGHRQQLQLLFAPEFWRARPEDALILLSGTPDCYKEQLNEAKIAGDMARLRRDKNTSRPASP
jgi:hypothetical protein